jgi:hypothetical protein
VETAWRMRSPTGRILECGIYRTDAGFEARMGYGEQLCWRRRTRVTSTALDWQQSDSGIRSVEGFSPLPLEDLPSIEPIPGGRYSPMTATGS